jgi:hypothetical protein
MNIKEFYELIKEASLGNVIISGEDWPIYFNTVTPNLEANCKVNSYY